MPEIMEKFSWLTKDFKVQKVSDKSVVLKVKAGKGEAVSKNKRKYLDEEFEKSARTASGQKMDVNHDKRQVGKVHLGDYEDGELEFVCEVWKEPYVTLLRIKSSEIRGFSIGANYLFNECAVCHKKFATEEEYFAHMRDEEFIRDGIIVPRGIHFDEYALSIVTGKETPGLDTSYEIMETEKRVSEKGFLQLLETIIKEKEKEHMTKKETVKVENAGPPYIKEPVLEGLIEEQPRTDAERAKAHFNISDEDWEKLTDAEKQEYIDKLPPRGSAVEQDEAPEPPCPEGWHEVDGKCVKNEPQEAQEQEEHECPEGQHKDPETGQCVPDKIATEQEETPTPPCPEGWHEVDGKCVRDTEEPPAQETIKLGSVKLLESTSPKPKLVTLREAKTIEKLSLAEPCDWSKFGYSSFDDCVAQNSDKGDPEAYCGSLKAKEKLEIARFNKVVEAVNSIREELSKPIQFELPVIDESWRQQTKQLAEAVNKVTTYIKALPKDDLSWKKMFENLPKDDLSWKQMFESLPKDDLGWKDIKPYDDTAIKTELGTVKESMKDVAQKADLEPIGQLVKEIQTLKESIEGKFKEYDSIKEAVKIADQSVTENKNNVIKLEEKIKQ